VVGETVSGAEADGAASAGERNIPAVASVVTTTRVTTTARLGGACRREREFTMVIQQ